MPNELAVIVAVPAVVPATVTTYWPLASVKPAVAVTGVMVTEPVPMEVTLIAAPETRLPPASLAVKVTVTGDAPVLGTILPEEVTARVEPVIWMGS